MTVAETVPLVSTAFLAGLLGSGHCFGMCGGIAGGLGALAAAPGRGQVLASAALFNLGRVLTYGLLGGVTALLIGAAGEMLSVPTWSRWLRAATALMIFLIGLRFLFGWNTIAAIEQAGSGLWRRISPLAVRAARRPGPTGRLLLGMTWGFLPCGLVYTLLLTAASTGEFLAGAVVMLAFGAGTLPAMLGLTAAAPSIASFLDERWTRRVIGLSMVMLAAWALWLLAGVGGGAGHGAHAGHRH